LTKVENREFCFQLWGIDRTP